MATSSTTVNNQLIKFRKDVITDFLRPHRFESYMGASVTMPIVMMDDFKSDGKQVNIPLVNQLQGKGVGAGILSGAEEGLDDYGFPVFTDWARNAATWTKADLKDASFAIPEAQRMNLRNWAKKTIRDDITQALLSIPTGAIQAGRGLSTNGGNRVNGLRWADATAAQRNAWVTANVDRVVFGSQISNYSTTAATALANVDTTNDKLSTNVVSLLKQVAQATTADGNQPAINPWMQEEEDEEWYVLFVGSRGMRDLRQDPAMVAANRDARSREAAGVDKAGGNPIFAGGSLVWDGVIIREIPEITNYYTIAPGAPLSNVGASSAPVEPVFLLGQAALAYGVGQLPKLTKDNVTDYDFRDNQGIEAQYGVAKIARQNTGSTAMKDFGMVTGFVAAAANA